jgi:pimeloyl-ACP methyl ester carboxylesterase
MSGWWVAVLLGVGHGGMAADAAPNPDRYVAESASEWRDPSPHRVGFVTADGVRLHYLDWGGRGETILFLPGLGSTAHAFDDIAPKLTDRFRVVALTPRAHGESGAADTLYTVQRAVDDLKVLMDTLSIVKAHLIGQSISGATLTLFAARHPARVTRLVYLDATFDYGGVEEAKEESKAVPRPRPAEGFSSAAEYRTWAEKYFFGSWTDALEADMWASASAQGPEAELQSRARAALLADAAAHPKDYRPLRVPALALWARKTLDTHYFWIDRSDTGTVRRARDHLENYRGPWERKGVTRFRREARNGRVVVFPGHHSMVVANEGRVLREIRGFLLERNR